MSLRLGFLGAGWVAQRATGPAAHAARGVVLQAAASRDEGRARALEPAGRVHAAPDPERAYRALLADDDVDAVYVNLTNEAHLPWTLAALAAGKHVLCEKPLGLDAGQVERMAAAARTADRVLVEALWYRWHPRTGRLAELVGSGALGGPVVVDAAFAFDGLGTMRATGNYRLDPARGGGALFDVGCYVASAAHLLLGDGPVEVSGARVRPDPTGVDVGFDARLRAAAGAATLTGGFDSPETQRLRVTGPDATVAAAGGEAFTAWNEPASLVLATADGRVREERFPPVDAYALMFEQLARACRGEEAFVVGLEHSAAVARTLAGVRSVSSTR